MSFYLIIKSIFPLRRYFNGNPLKIDNENIKLGTTPEGNHCLLIEKVTPENSGEYEVFAKNDIGDDSSKARLTVSCKNFFIYFISCTLYTSI